MSRKFIATILAGALAVTAFAAAPARADSKDVAKALAGIAALAIIAKAIDDRRDDKRKQTHVHTPTRNYGNQHRYPAVRGHVQPRPLPGRVSRKLLPGACMVDISGRNRKVRAFGSRCLANNRVNVNALPNNCRIQVRGNRQSHVLYEANCLRNHGYSLARY
ncbi:hypothetical protein [Lacimonas salitolerans]|uniref:Uncharacterized protein n=1 Tax=Lacimonas salitolerans TaxID=1323750 RepID=A0ABW4ED42_9RHOB